MNKSLEDIIKEYRSRDELYDSLLLAVNKAKEVLKKAENRLDKERSKRKLILQESTFFAPYSLGDEVEVFNAKNLGSMFNPKMSSEFGFISRIIPVINRKNKIRYEYKIKKRTTKGLVSTYFIGGKYRTYEESEFKLVEKINENENS